MGKVLGEIPPALHINNLKKAVWDEVLNALERSFFLGVLEALRLERTAKKDLLPMALLPYFETAFRHSGKTHPSRLSGDDRSAILEMQVLLERPATTEGLFRALANKVLETHAAPNKTVGEAPSTSSPNHKRSVWTKSLGSLAYHGHLCFESGLVEVGDNKWVEWASHFEDASGRPIDPRALGNAAYRLGLNEGGRSKKDAKLLRTIHENVMALVAAEEKRRPDAME